MTSLVILDVAANESILRAIGWRTLEPVGGVTWSGNDGFDPRGRRVLGVVRCLDHTPFPHALGDDPFAPRLYWEAFVADNGRFDHVLVAGRPGRRADRNEA